MEIKKYVPPFNLKYTKFSLSDLKMVDFLDKGGYLDILKREISRLPNPQEGEPKKPLFDDILDKLGE